VETLVHSLQALAEFEFPNAEKWDYIQTLLEESEALIRKFEPGSQVDPCFYLAKNYYLLAELKIRRGQGDPARKYAQESLRLFRERSHEWYLISPYFILGTIEVVEGNYQLARQYLTTALIMVAKYGHMVGGACLATLCELEYRQGNWAQAVDLCKDYIHLAKEVQTPFNVCERLEMLSKIMARQKCYLKAACLSGAAEALSQKFGRKVSSTSHEIIIPDWRTRSPEVSLEYLIPDWPNRPDGAQIIQSWDKGRSMTYEEAIEYALDLAS